MEFAEGEVEFFVDDLLDLGEEEEEEEEDPSKDSLSAVDGSSVLSFQPFPSSEPILPQVGDVAELEWVSRFVDDSYSDMPAAVFAASPAAPAPATTAWVKAVPAKARTKRARPVTRPWTLSSPVLLSESSSSCSSSSSSSTFPAVTSKKKPRRAGPPTEATRRRCTHCGADRTPQWRAGPMGPKTLCNACGVRYKSGRLLPEYRPAGSPTFVSHVHSNSHRKVLELRRRKGTIPPASCGALPAMLAAPPHACGVV